MDGAKPPNQARAEEINVRQIFNRDLQQCMQRGPNEECPNAVTNFLIFKMSRRLESEGVELRPEHDQNLRGSLKEGKNICDTMRSEREFALSTPEQTPTVLAGKGAHKILEFGDKITKKEK